MNELNPLWTREELKAVEENVNRFLSLSPEDQQAELDAIMAKNLASCSFTFNPEPEFKDGDKVNIKLYDGKILEGFIIRKVDEG